MANLIIPDKAKHQYIIGIDFGHGETSAAICKIEWDKDAGMRETNVQDIDMDVNARKKVIISSICRRIDGGFYIGDEAFEHMTDNNGIRICFKNKPESLEGDAEKLMMDYMRTVYARIREGFSDELTDTNHVVYIARPSGWVEEEAKELYRQMALNAGIPLAGLTSESRAAIFYAKSPNVNFSKEISKGAIVFDLGSSTLDFTYLSDESTPIDYGYNLGASIIDEAILKYILSRHPTVNDFVTQYPEYRDSLKFRARKFKEEAYGRTEGSKLIDEFTLRKFIKEDSDAYDEYGGAFVSLYFKNIMELNDMVNQSTHYLDRMCEGLKDFRDNHIPGKKVNGVFLTGGASRMNFIRPLIADVFGLSDDKVRIDNDNPSLTISRGIALLGATDAITSVLVKELRNKIPQFVNNDKMMANLRDKLATNITDAAWDVVEDACKYWIKFGNSTDTDELKNVVQKHLKEFQSYKAAGVVNSTLQSFIKESSEDIRKSMNDIIRRYAPDREISISGNVNIGNIDGIDSTLSDMSSIMGKICDEITNILADILWAALAVFLWGILCAPWYIYKWLRSDESKRKDKVDDVLGKETEVKGKTRSQIYQKLATNKTFANTVASALSNHFTKLIDSHLQKVMIPIE